MKRATWFVVVAMSFSCGDTDAEVDASLDAASEDARGTDAARDAEVDASADAALPDAAIRDSATSDAAVGCAPGASSDDGPLRAFPEAEGFGANAEGGRGGEVIEVTSLDDEGPGTLREAIRGTTPRTIVFRVGGTIATESTLLIDGDYVTIAGQTAPGGGIQIRNASGGHATMVIHGSHVIVRHLRIRTGPGGEADTLRVSGGSSDVIIDHCSLSWSVDELFSTYDSTNNTTVQWTLLAEPLNQSTHGDGGHSMAMLTGPLTHRFSAHHNVFAHGSERAPRVQAGDYQFVGNLVYDFQRSGYFGATGNTSNPIRAEFRNNYYRDGVLTIYRRAADLGTSISLVDGNRREFPDGVILADRERRPWQGPGEDTEQSHSAIYGGTDDEAVFAEFPPIRAAAAEDLDDLLLPSVGAAPRDAVDARVIATFASGTGGFVDDPSEVGGWPTLEAGTPPADADHDGMPDSFEARFGFDAEDPADGSLDADEDGYTNLEEYLNGTLPLCL
ncbi:MAG: pectate lyase [Polyangiales bacterium]